MMGGAALPCIRIYLLLLAEVPVVAEVRVLAEVA